MSKKIKNSNKNKKEIKKNTKQNTKINSKLIIGISVIISLLAILLTTIFSLNSQNVNTNSVSTNEIETTPTINDTQNQTSKNSVSENEIATNEEGITIIDLTDNIYYEFVNTNYVLDYTFFTPTTNTEFKGGNYDVITTYDEFINFTNQNNIDISTEKFSSINEKYFKSKFIICVIDSYEETYQHRLFSNFIIENANTYIKYIKTDDEIKDETGYWTYMIGVEYSMIGETEIERLPINIQVE